MPSKAIVTVTYEKDQVSSSTSSIIENLEKHGTISAVLIPSLSCLQIFIRNFMIGVARGLGFFVGGTVIIGILVWIVQSIVSMNIPYLTELFRQLLTFIKMN